jgi:hypothetical protein
MAHLIQNTTYSKLRSLKLDNNMQILLWIHKLNQHLGFLGEVIVYIF